MEDQGKLLESLEEIKNIAEAQQGKLSQEEIQKYLDDMNLTKDQMEAVYHYLEVNHIQVEGHQYVPDDSPEEEVPDEAKNYEWNKEITSEILREFLQGDESGKEKVVNSLIPYVKRFSQNYKKRKVLKDELIAEGNLGLVMGIQVVLEDVNNFYKDSEPDKEKIFAVIGLEIKQAMENYIDEELGVSDQEQAMLAKINLIHEATKYMAEDLGRIPTVAELAEYTRISQEEIRMVMDISKDTKRVANDVVPRETVARQILKKSSEGE